MLDHCITFYRETGPEEDDTVVYHCHATAPDEALAVEAALRGAIHDNVSLVGATYVAVRVMVDLPPGLMESMDALRRAQHGTAVPVQQASSRLH